MFPELLGIEVVELAAGRLVARLPLREQLMAPNGYLHGGAVITLADTAAGYGCRSNLPDGAQGFTTIELKTNFVGTAREGTISCEATMIHGGRSTQVWDAKVDHDDSGRAIALFRCTQMILWPR